MVNFIKKILNTLKKIKTWSDFKTYKGLYKLKTKYKFIDKKLLKKVKFKKFKLFEIEFETLTTIFDTIIDGLTSKEYKKILKKFMPIKTIFYLLKKNKEIRYIFYHLKNAPEENYVSEKIFNHRKNVLFMNPIIENEIHNHMLDSISLFKINSRKIKKFLLENAYSSDIFEFNSIQATINTLTNIMKLNINEKTFVNKTINFLIEKYSNDIKYSKIHDETYDLLEIMKTGENIEEKLKEVVRLGSEYLQKLMYFKTRMQPKLNIKLKTINNKNIRRMINKYYKIR